MKIDTLYLSSIILMRMFSNELVASSTMELDFIEIWHHPLISKAVISDDILQTQWFWVGMHIGFDTRIVARHTYVIKCIKSCTLNCILLHVCHAYYVLNTSFCWIPKCFFLTFDLRINRIWHISAYASFTYNMTALLNSFVLNRNPFHLNW